MKETICGCVQWKMSWVLSVGLQLFLDFKIFQYLWRKWFLTNFSRYSGSARFCSNSFISFMFETILISKVSTWIGRAPNRSSMSCFNWTIAFIILFCLSNNRSNFSERNDKNVIEKNCRYGKQQCLGRFFLIIAISGLKNWKCHNLNDYNCTAVIFSILAFDWQDSKFTKEITVYEIHLYWSLSKFLIQTDPLSFLHQWIPCWWSPRRLF